MKELSDFTIREKRELGGGDWLLKLAPEPGRTLPKTEPGQFVNILVENSRRAFLRRPVSVCCVHEGLLWLWIRNAGEGTAAILSLREGDRLNLLLPLGRGFSMPASFGDEVLLVGGGVGCAPLLYLGDRLHALGYKPSFLLAGRSVKNIHLLQEFQRFGPVYITTEDGSEGVQGLCTDHPALRDEASRWKRIYCCGPTPMMKAVAAIAASAGTDCEVSLENHMACGLGACLCCVTDTTAGRKCVCTEGPVFNTKDLKL